VSSERLGVPDRIRTCDPLLRRQPLYPLSYRDGEGRFSV
jgi:hypothetical protein